MSRPVVPREETAPSKVPPPRKLTSEEISAITNKIYFLKTFVPANQSLIEENYRSEITKYLEEIKIVPVNQEILELGKKIVYKYQESFIPAGSSIGSLVSEALTRELTQDALDGKKNTGKSNFQVSHLTVFEEIVAFTETQNSSLVNSLLYLKGTNSFDRLFQDKIKYRQLTLEDIVLDHNYPEKPKKFFEVGYETRLSNQNYWYPWVDKLESPEPIKSSSYFVRLKIDVNKLYRYRITLGRVCERLKGVQDHMIECYPSPVFYDQNVLYGYIDLYPLEDIIVKTYQQTKRHPVKKEIQIDSSSISVLSLMFLNNVILKNLDIFNLKGINHLSSYQIRQDSIVDFLEASTKIGDRWKLWVNYGRLHSKGLTPDFFREVLDYLELPYQFQEGDPYFEVKSDEDPAQLITQAHSKLNQGLEDHIEEQSALKEDTRIKEGFQSSRRVRLIPPRYSSKKNTLFNSFYVFLGGSNLRDLFILPEVDTNRTISYDLHQAYRFFGISVVRNVIITRLIDLFQQAGIYVDPAHIILFADYMCFPGEPIKIGYYGQRERGEDLMVQAITKIPMDSISQGSLFGQKASVHTSIGMSMIGQASTLGRPEEEKETSMESESKSVRLDLDTQDLIDQINGLELQPEQELPPVSTSDLNQEEQLSSQEDAIIEVPPPSRPPFPTTVVGDRARLNRIPLGAPEGLDLPCPPSDRQFTLATMNEEEEIIQEEPIELDQAI